MRRVDVDRMRRYRQRTRPEPRPGWALDKMAPALRIPFLPYPIPARGGFTGQVEGESITVREGDVFVARFDDDDRQYFAIKRADGSEERLPCPPWRDMLGVIESWGEPRPTGYFPTH